MASERAAPLADGPAAVTVSAPRLLAKGYMPYERFELTLTTPSGATLHHNRDVLRASSVAAVLPIDPERGEVVLIRQFRLAAHLVDGRGAMIEVVAGRVEPGEVVSESARRECLEEIGVAPRALVELFTILPTPGLTDEQITLFAGLVDAAAVPPYAGSAQEHEETEPMRVPIAVALDALVGGKVRNGLTVIALQWLALNRHRLDQVLR